LGRVNQHLVRHMGRMGAFGLTNYSSAKAGALHGFTKSLGARGGEKGRHHQYHFPPDTSAPSLVIGDPLRKLLESNDPPQIPIDAPWGKPEKVAGWLATCRSDEAAFVDRRQHFDNGGQHMVLSGSQDLYCTKQGLNMKRWALVTGGMGGIRHSHLQGGAHGMAASSWPNCLPGFSPKKTNGSPPPRRKANDFSPGEGGTSRTYASCAAIWWEGSRLA